MSTKRIVFVVHYYPPINSSGAKRVEALSKYLAADGHDVTVITTQKTSADGDFTEATPPDVRVVELNWLGRSAPSVKTAAAFEPMYTGKPSLKRRTKDFVMRMLGQLPDPRLPFALSFATPWLAREAREALSRADIVIGSTPPWPMLLAALIAKWRFKIACILDYRDHFSECHEMPGGPFAKWLERIVDRRLVNAADSIVAISPPMADYYRGMTERIHCILNGFDHEVLDAARARSAITAGDRPIVARYMGIVSPGRVPHNVMQALVTFAAEQPERFAQLRFEFYGNAALIKEAIETKYPSIGAAFSYHAAVPYLESLKLIVQADYLLFAETSSKATISAQGILTTKLFEYVGSGRPILADISPDTLAGSLLVKTGSGHVVGTSPQLFLDALRRPGFFTRRPDDVSDSVMKYSRRAQASEYAELISRVAQKA